ncbi:MAG: bZIP transcription factor [Ruminococcus sp.]|nr:bZIP transcription factor [Ruminococcus sp.]
MKGDKRCCICGAWLGNYVTGETPTGQASYYSIIKRKYCPECRPWKRNLDFRFYSHEYRKRKKLRDKERERTLTLLKAENQALKQIIAEMREK